MLNVAVNLGEKIILVGHSNGGLIAFNLSTNPKTQIDSEYDQYQKPAQAGILVSNLILATFGSTEESRANAYLKMKVPTLIFTTADDDVISHEELLNTQKTAPNTFKVIIFEKGSNVYHDNIQRSRKDVVDNAPQSWVHPNPEQLQLRMTQFLSENNL